MKHILLLFAVASLMICFLVPVAAQDRSINDVVEAVEGYQEVLLPPPGNDRNQ